MIISKYELYLTIFGINFIKMYLFIRWPGAGVTSVPGNYIQLSDWLINSSNTEMTSIISGYRYM